MKAGVGETGARMAVMLLVWAGEVNLETINDAFSEKNGARYRVRTCGPHHVKVMLYH
jgi:hypothetical protein